MLEINEYGEMVMTLKPGIDQYFDVGVRATITLKCGVDIVFTHQLQFLSSNKIKNL